MRSAVWSIARAARPVGARSALRVNAPPAVAALHTSAPRRDEEKAVAPAEEAAPSILSHWSVQSGVGFLLAIPLVQTEMIILSEEVQLVGVFGVFVALAYQGSSAYLSEVFDVRKKTVQAEHNALEQAAIDTVKEVIDAHKKRLTLLEDMAVVKDTYQGVINTMESSATFEFQHAKRAEMVKMLDAVAARTSALQSATQLGLVQEASAAVVANFAKDAKSKEATLAAAITAVGDPAKGAAAGKPVDALFSGFFKAKATEMKGVAGKPMKLSAADKAAAADEIAAILARDGINAGDVPSADELISKVTY